MDTSEQVNGVADAAPEWRLDPAVVTQAVALLARMETEYARLKEQYDRVEASGVKDYDPGMNIYWWLDDIRDAIDALEDVDHAPEPADEPDDGDMVRLSDIFPHVDLYEPGQERP